MRGSEKLNCTVLQSFILQQNTSFRSELHDQDSRFSFPKTHIEALIGPLESRIYGVLEKFFEKCWQLVVSLVRATAFKDGSW